MDGDGWRQRNDEIRAARRAILDEYNVMQLMVRIASELLQRPSEPGSTTIFAERFWEESKSRYSPRQMRLRKLLGNSNPAIDRLGYTLKHSFLLSAVTKPFRRVKQALRRTKSAVINRWAR